MTNRLAEETSPYLRQHADNPVDWYPWGSEAFEKAAAEDKPVFLSIGYSACHWCHVMAHESFEDGEIAAFLNEHFVSVKVDREERPEVDAIYMDAVQALTGHGGWPMSVFLTPEQVPFYGGTYFPPRARRGTPGFLDLLQQVATLWEHKRDDVLAAGDALKDALLDQNLVAADAGADELAVDALEFAVRNLTRTFDSRHGGWGGAPKFPQPAVLEFLLRRYTATGDEDLLGMVAQTLDAMMRGGIYDQLGGGFHRYATDERWLVPHFEKMLYDNAQLARVYLHAWQVTANPEYRRVVTGILDYAVREMLDAGGGFYSAQDADSEGEEGRHFVWTADEVRQTLAGTAAEPDTQLALSAFGVTERGNFEGANVLSEAMRPTDLAAESGLSVDEVTAHVERARDILLAAREARVKPDTDDKVLAGWNGLMLSALAEAARVLGRDDYRAVAERTARFLLEQMRADDGRLLRSWRNGQAKLNGYLEDHAAVAEGLLELYRTTFDARWFEAARELGDLILARFVDPGTGFYDTSDDHEQLVLRPATVQDGAVPSGASIAADVLVRLAEYTGEAAYEQAAEVALLRLQGTMGQVPLGMARWLSVLDLVLSPPSMLAVVGPDTQPLIDAVRMPYLPDVLVAAAPDGDASPVPALHGKQPVDGHAAAYVCVARVCEQPVTETTELEELLELAAPVTC